MSSEESDEKPTKKLKECGSEEEMEPWKMEMDSSGNKISTPKDSTREAHDSEEDIFFDCSPLVEHHSPASSDTSQNADVAIQIEDDDKEEFEAATVGRCSWRGVSLAEISKGCDSPQLPPIAASDNHAVLFKLPWTQGEVPDAYPRNPRNVEDAWDSEHVRMPCSPQSLYAVGNSEGKNVLQARWELVLEALKKPIRSSHELQEAILSYNSKYASRWDFTSLHKFFNEVMGEDESDLFFTNILPNIVLLAVDLPSVVKSPIPLLRQHRERSISLSQLQVASLLANAFLCTFPRRNTAQKNSEYANFPDINFNRLFGRGAGGGDRNVEKLKCIFNYFRRVCHKMPDGTITFTRRFIERRHIPRWDRSEKMMPELHISSRGTIEDQGGGMLQVDFANSFVGGGVLGSGLVQEEIRFLICPELILSRLFTEELDATEALVITGCERYSRQRGYADSFLWAGNYVDETPRDSSGRRHCTVVAIDALYLRNPALQFSSKYVLRELNKAYVGFHNPDLPAGERLSPVATGNWGCGAFRGKATIKSLLQLMAAAEAGRNVAYFTFHDEDLRDQIYDMHSFLSAEKVTVGRLWRLLHQYHESSYRDGQQTKDLYAYLYQAVLSREKAPVQTTLDRFQQTSTDTPKPNVRRPQTRESSRTEPKSSTSTILDSDDLTKALEALPEFEDETPTEEKTVRTKVQPNINARKSHLFEALDASEGIVSTKAEPKSPSKFLEAFERRQNTSNSASQSHSVQSSDSDTIPIGPTSSDEPTSVGNSQPEHKTVESDSTRSRPGSGSSSVSGNSTPKRRISDYFNTVPNTKSK